MIVTTKFVKKIQKSMKRKLYQFISSEKRIELCSACNQVGVRIIEVQIIEVWIIEDALYHQLPCLLPVEIILLIFLYILSEYLPTTCMTTMYGTCMCE